MKKIIITLCIAICTFHIGIAQYVYTPHGSAVNVYQYAGTDYNDTEKAARKAIIERDYPRVKVVGEATRTYNCHSYAWYMYGNPSATPVIMTWPNVYYSSADNSYGEIKKPLPVNTRVVYPYMAHSAVYIGGGKFISKWGPDPLIEHEEYDVDPDYLTWMPSINAYMPHTYYVRTPMAITPPSYIECQSTGNVFSITPALPSGTTYNWFVTSGPLVLQGSSSGNTAKFSAPYVSDWTGSIVVCSVTLANNINQYLYSYVYISPCYSPRFTFSPNPASDIVNIEIDTKVYENANARSANVTPNFDIRLYDSRNNLVRNTTSISSKMQINVSDLPNGTYSLYVYDGLSSNPGVQQIRVQR